MPRPSSDRSTVRFDSLTSLRFFAVLLVFCFHRTQISLFADEVIADAYRRAFAHAGHFAASFFFVLSGFVLMATTETGTSWLSFMRRRAARIYPTHLVGLAAVVLVFGSTTTVKSFLWVPNALLLHTWIPVPETIFGGHGSTWSLAVLISCSVLFPVMRLWLYRVRGDRLWGCAGVLLAAVVAITAITVIVLPRTPVLPETQVWGFYQFWFAYVFPPVRALDFVLGMVLARLVLEGWWVPLRVSSALGVVGLFYSSAMLLPRELGYTVLPLLSATVLVPAVAASDLRGTPSLLRNGFLVWLGELAYGFFLVHLPVILLSRMLVGVNVYYGVSSAIGITVAELVVSVLTAWLLRAVVERPCQRWLSPARAFGGEKTRADVVRPLP